MSTPFAPSLQNGLIKSVGGLVALASFSLPAAVQDIRWSSGVPQNAVLSVHLPSQMKHTREIYLEEDEQNLSRFAPTLSGEEMAGYVFEILDGNLKGRWRSQAFRIARVLIEEANYLEMDPLFILAVIARESRFDPEVRGRHGEIGLMQLRPSTALWVQAKAGVRFDDLADPVDNIRVGIAYLQLLRMEFKNQSFHYIAAYNMGASNVRSLLRDETQPNIYRGHVMRYYEALRFGAAGHSAESLAARLAAGW